MNIINEEQFISELLFKIYNNTDLIIFENVKKQEIDTKFNIKFLISPGFL